MDEELHEAALIGLEHRQIEIRDPRSRSGEARLERCGSEADKPSATQALGGVQQGPEGGRAARKEKNGKRIGAGQKRGDIEPLARVRRRVLGLPSALFRGQVRAPKSNWPLEAPRCHPKWNAVFLEARDRATDPPARSAGREVPDHHLGLGGAL
jgi:hypothetical protein